MAPGNLSIIFAGRKFLRKSKDNHNNESLLDSFTKKKVKGEITLYLKQIDRYPFCRLLK